MNYSAVIGQQVLNKSNKIVTSQNTSQVSSCIFLHVNSVIHIVRCMWTSLLHFMFEALISEVVVEANVWSACWGKWWLRKKHRTKQEKSEHRSQMYCSSLSYNKAWSGVLVSHCCASPGREKKTNYLELSTMYCTILSRTFSKRAVRTQMCLMAWAERGWGGRLVVEEPCLLRGSWPMLWVLLQDTKHNIINDCFYREEVMFVFAAWWT